MFFWGINVEFCPDKRIWRNSKKLWQDETRKNVLIFCVSLARVLQNGRILRNGGYCRKLGFSVLWLPSWHGSLPNVGSFFALWAVLQRHGERCGKMGFKSMWGRNRIS